MTDTSLHRRCIFQVERERRIFRSKIRQFVVDLPSNQYVAPELVEEILEMRTPLPEDIKNLGGGVMPNELGSVISRDAYWTKFVEWMRRGSR